MNAASAERALIFAWERVRRMPMVLPAFLLLSFVVHVAAFFAFRVVYPPQASLRPPPPPITILDPARPDHQALLRWAEAEDPAPAATQSQLTDRLLEVRYRPSYAAVRTAPLTLAPEVGRAQYPPARDPLHLIRSVEPAQPRPPSPPEAANTRMNFSGELAARASDSGQLAWASRSRDPLEPAEFLVGVTERGEVRFVVLQRSSGNRELDQEAANHLRNFELTQGSAPVEWGHATVNWGADVYLSSK